MALAIKSNLTGLWPAQAEAISNLEVSLRHFRPRALIQMATGSGKTFTAITAAYRLIKFGDAQRILFAWATRFAPEFEKGLANQLTGPPFDGPLRAALLSDTPTLDSRLLELEALQGDGAISAADALSHATFRPSRRNPTSFPARRPASAT